jgi:DNA-binding TFAR19-related protein (PDSD5 family)
VAERAARLVASRLRLYDHVGPLMRATLLHSGQNAVLAERLATVRRLLGEQVEQMFAPELARRAPAERRGAVAVLDQLLSFESIEHLRRVRGLSRAGSANALEAAVVQLLA